MNIIEAIHDQNLFRHFFRDLASWAVWIALLKFIFGLPMADEEMEVCRRLTGRQNPSLRQFVKVLILAGRRAGKGSIAALIAAFVACILDHSHLLSPGERGVVMVIAADRAQAAIVFRQILALIEGSPMLAALIERKTAEAIDLTNGISIEVRTASFRTVRGRAIVCGVCDEISFWLDENSANPAAEIIGAIEPGMATIPGAMLLMITTPYRRSGPPGDLDRRYYGVEDEEVLVIRGDTRTFNPTVPKSIIDRAFEEDETAAWSEYGRDGEIRFRPDVSDFLPRETVDVCVVPGRRELPPVAQFRYEAFADPAAGGNDEFTLAIAHPDNGKAVLDCVRGRKGSPESIISEYAGLLKSYRCSSVTGDKYAAAFVVEAFARHGIRYEHSTRSRSEIYTEVLPALNAGRVELLDDPKLISQFSRLERRTARGGRDTVDHPPGQHDDLSNSVSGALVLVAQERILPGIGVAGPWAGHRSEKWANAEDIH